MGIFSFSRALVRTSFHSKHDKKVAYFILLPLGNRNEKKTSLRVSREVLGNLERNTKRGERMMRPSAKCRLSQKVPKFLSTTALQHCKLSFLLAEVGGFLPPYRFNCLWACSFQCQFHDLRLVCHDADETGLKIVRSG